MSEHDEQAAFIEWCDLQIGQYPQLKWMFAIPNGGHRHVRVAAKMKAEGVKAGVLDLCLPYPNGGYHGLYLETKFGNNRPTKEQVAWIAWLVANDYAVRVCYGCDELIAATEWYLSLD